MKNFTQIKPVKIKLKNFLIIINFYKNAKYI